jgi:hypothetical protein
MNLTQVRKWLGLKPRINDFAATLLKEFARRGSPGWVYDAREQQLTQAGGAVINLGNMFVEYSRSRRGGRAALLDKYSNFAVMQSREIPKLWEVAAKALYPVLRCRFDYLSLEIESRGAGKPWPALLIYSFHEDLHVRIAYDWGSHLAQVKEEFLDIWGQSRESILARALGNLAALQKPAWSPQGNGVYALVSDVSYEESMLLLDKVVEQVPVPGPAVFLPSNRGVLLACDATRADDLVAMIDAGSKNHQERPWPLSGSVLARRDGRWQDAMLPQEAARSAGDLQRMHAAMIHNGQKQALEAYHQKIGRDSFVATFGLYRWERDGGAIRSCCSWTEGVDSLLPKTDYILFVRPGDKTVPPILATWDRAATEFSHRMKDAGESPARFAVEGTFTPAEWQTIASMHVL